jgi:hypothetical protein
MHFLFLLEQFDKSLNLMDLSEYFSPKHKEETKEEESIYELKISIMSFEFEVWKGNVRSWM